MHFGTARVIGLEEGLTTVAHTPPCMAECMAVSPPGSESGWESASLRPVAHLAETAARAGRGPRPASLLRGTQPRRLAGVQGAAQAGNAAACSEIGLALYGRTRAHAPPALCIARHNAARPSRRTRPDSAPLIAKWDRVHRPRHH